MPDAVTHIYTSDLIQEKIQNEWIKKHIDLFHVGAQGSDPYFYHHPFPWQKNLGAPKLGNMIHHRETKPFLETLIQNAKTIEDKVFTLGFLTHFSLDTIAHPYIFYKSGLYDSMTQKNRGTHLAFERSIDSFILEGMGYNAHKVNIGKIFFSPTSLPDSIGQLMEQSVKSVYGTSNAGNLFLNAYKDFKFVFQNMAHDPLGWKHNLLKIADLFMNSSQKFQNISNYKIREEHVDYLNTNKTEWRHPVTGDSFHTSFDELISQAVERGNKLLSLTIDYFQTGSKEIFDTIENLSYDTGLPPEQNKMIYFNEVL